MAARTMLVLATLVLVAGEVGRAMAQAENTPEWRERLVEEKKYAEAYDAYKQALANDPENPSLLFNTGLLAYLSDNPKEAIAPWMQLKALEPDSWRIRAKLIQAYEAAGETKKRDEERDELFKLRKNTEDPELKKVKFYCRDQFSVGKSQLMVFEYFELEGEEPIRLSFDVLEADGKPVQTRYSLGSYQMINAMAAERKELKEGERLFHLDGYKRRGRDHETYVFFNHEPGYEVVKKFVKEILEEKRKPVSGTYPGKQ